MNDMKKLALTFAIVLGLSLTTFADPNQGGLFQRGEATEPTPDAIYGIRTAGMPNLPTHNLSDNQDAPLGSGIALLLGLGGAYLLGKKRREE
jgi:hypothetical protein